MSTPQSLEKFLGILDHSSGPFGLLVIDPRRCDEAAIVASLHARLARVSAHPQSRTPEADQVRLALHAAAAQLMDPAMRARLLKAQGVDESKFEKFDPLAEEAAPPPLPVREVPKDDGVDPALRRDTRVLLGAFGGLNPQSHRRLTMLAQARGVSADQMQRVLTSLTPSAGASDPLIANTGKVQWKEADGYVAPEKRPLEEQIDPGYLVLDKFLKLGAVFVIAMGLLGGIIYLIVKGSSPAPAPKPPPIVTDTSKTKVNESPTGLFSNTKSAEKTEPEAKSADPTGIEAIAALRKLAGKSGVDSNALIGQLDKIAKDWFNLPPDQIASLQDSMVEGMYRLSGEEAQTLVEALVQRTAWMKDSAIMPSESQVSDAVLACGLLTRLSKEESFPPLVRHSIDGAIAGVFEQAKRTDERTFQSGAQAALNAAVDRLSSRWDQTAPNASSWGRWARVAIASGGSSKFRLVLITLEGLLSNAPDPSQNKIAFDAIGELAGALDVTGDPEVRNWILRWLVAPGIDAGHLFALTSRLADNPSRSGGIDHTLVVPTSATERARAELRERYAKVWGIGDLAEGDKVRTAWVERAKRELSAPAQGNSTGETMGRLRNWARLNDAASLLWSGNQKDASDAIDSVAPVVPPPPSPTTTGPGPTSYVVDFGTGSSDGSFGAKYFSLPPADRTRLVSESFKGEEIGPRDAAVVVMEYIRTGSTSTKAALKELIRRRSNDRFLLRALLDFSPSFPRAREVSELIENVTGAKLPATDEPSWRIEARRAIVEANLARIARYKEFSTLDSDAEEIASGYWKRLGVQSVAGLTPDRVAFKLTERWRQQARVLIPTGREGWTIDQIERKLGSRRAQARGIVQRFAAEQLGIVELLAYTIANESPQRATEIKKLIDASEKEVAGQGSVLSQVEILERTLTSLWKIRFEDHEGAGPT